MKIGILSDTHGRREIAIRAAEMLRQRGAEYLIHCGDVGDESVLDALAPGPAAFVFGNNDFDHQSLRRYAADIKVTCLADFGVLELGGTRIAVTHGDHAPTLSRIAAGQPPCDYLLTGHTHVRHDQQLGQQHAVRWINPGALYRASRKSVALLDLISGSLVSLAVAD